jgi:tRNA 2-thiocytidine biosynthesis protein TtcA
MRSVKWQTSTRIWERFTTRHLRCAIWRRAAKHFTDFLHWIYIGVVTLLAHSTQNPSLQGLADEKRLNRSRKSLRRDVGRAIADFNMIEDGDLIMVCLSGGKDSYTMLDILLHLKKHAPIHFDIKAVNLDQKQPGFPEEVLPAYLSALGIEYHIIERDTYSIVKDKIPEGKTTCGLCSRLRRGILYNFAEANGVTKIALGHHRDDLLETLLLNMFYGGKLKSMPPVLHSDDGRNTVIRPLAYCREKDLTRYAQMKEFPIIPCNLCGSQENLQRQVIKDMFQTWDEQHPGRLETMFRALCNVEPSHLADNSLYDFKQGERQTTGSSGSVGEAEPESADYGRLNVLNV